MISIICVYNNEEQLRKQLLESLKKQDIEYEFIPVKNDDGSFLSAASALNYGASMALGDIFIFSHQDIWFKTSCELRKLADAINMCEEGDIIGTQGTKEPNRFHYTNLTSGVLLIQNPNYVLEEQLYEVSCVDEGLFGMKKETWNEHMFDEDLCDNWHLYGVEMCLFARKHGHKVYVYPSQIHHFSKGVINIEYMNNLKKLCDVYRKDFKYIWTTCYKVRTNIFYINALFYVWCFNRWIQGRL